MRRSLFLLFLVLPASIHAAALQELLGQAGMEAPEPIAAPRGVAVPRSRRFTVLSFNIKANPHAWVNGWGERRLGWIGDELARRRVEGTAPDVVLLQECFGPGTPRLRQHAAYPHRVQGPGAEHSILDSGLWALSLHPIVAERELSYAPEGCRGADCLASKGAMLVRLSVPGVPFPVDVVTMHAQSGGKPKADAQRLRQLEQLRAFLPDGKAGPVLLAGDFNTDSRRPESFARLMSLGLTNAGQSCREESGGCVVAPGTDPEELAQRTHDQQLYTPQGAAYRVRPVSAARTFAPVGVYSDHLAYEVTYEIAW